MERSVGTGVVIIDNGIILTNLHVVSGADRIKVIFSDGLEADADDDRRCSPRTTWRCCRRSKIPDDLKPATMRSTGDLAPGRQGDGRRLPVRHRPVGRRAAWCRA